VEQSQTPVVQQTPNAQDKGKGKGKGKGKKGKGKAGPAPGSQVEAGPVIAENTKFQPGKPFTMPQGKPPMPTGVVALEPGQAMQMSSKLARIFLGLGWKNAGKEVDVDASVIAFKQGEVQGAVWYKELKNKEQTLAHTGDVLTGGGGNKELQDLERIYMYLEKIDPAVDMLVMVANIYTPGVDFSSLSEAYVRVANADTNQELGRMWLGGAGWTKMAAGKNAVVFAKAYRYGKHWQVMTLGQPLVVPGASDWRAMVPAIQKAGCVSPPPQQTYPGQLGQLASGVQMASGGQPPAIGGQPPATGGQATSGQPSQPATGGQPPAPATGGQPPAAGGQPTSGQPSQSAGPAKAQKPSKVWPCVAVAAGGAVGVGAAIAIFSSSEMNPGMLDPGQFTEGVDFGSLEVTSIVDGIDLAPPEELGDFVGDAMQAVTDGAASAAEWGGELAAGAWGVVNESGIFEGTAEFAGEAGNAMIAAGGGAAEWGGDAAEWGVEGLGAAGEWGGEAAGAAGEWGGEAVGAAGEWGGDAAEWGGEAAGAAGEWGGEAAGAAGEWGGEAVGAAGEWGGDAAAWGGEAVGAVGEFGGDAAGAVGEHAGEAAEAAGSALGALGGLFGD